MRRMSKCHSGYGRICLKYVSLYFACTIKIKKYIGRLKPSHLPPIAHYANSSITAVYVSSASIRLSYHLLPSCNPILQIANPMIIPRSWKLKPSVWKIFCMNETYTSASCVKNEIDTVVISILFCKIVHPSPRFWIADTKSRKTKHVKV